MLDIFTGIQKWFKNSSPRTQLFAALLVFSLLATAVLLLLAGGSGPSSDPMASAPVYLAGVFLKLILVLLLIVLSAVVFRRWMHLSPQSGTVRQMRVTETIRLSPKQTLYLVSVGEQQLLIGATDQNISLISPIENNPTLGQMEELQPAQGLDFGALVQSFNSEPPSESAGGKE